MPRTPSLEALRIFAVAARHLSFTEAATELNLTQSAVSHRIRCLEEELGLSLFLRLTRRLELTPRGRVLAQRVEHAIGEIDRGIVDLLDTGDGSLLKVTMTPAVASHWLIPRLARIRQRHPEVDVQLIADRRLLDLRAEGIELAVRFCRTPSASYHAVRLMSDRVIPVCTPGLLHRYGPVDSVDALLSLPLLHDSATEGDDSGTDWQSWLEFCGKPNVVCRAGQHFSDASMLINAAMLGLGVALARVSLVADHLANGALACPLPLPVPTDYSYYLLGLPEQVDRPKIVAFRKLLIGEAASTEAFGMTLGMPRPVAA
jgi:LysR family glycine cleavage system transcriptional activator